MEVWQATEELIKVLTSKPGEDIMANKIGRDSFLY